MDAYKKIEIYKEALNFERLEDYRQAFNLYQTSAQHGYARAQLAVAKFYLGEGIYKGVVKADKAKAIEYLNQAVSGGNVEAKYRLAVILLEKRNNDDTARALELLQDASDGEYYLAALELAKCHYYGVGFPQSCGNMLALFGKIVYGKAESAQRECSDGIRKILCEIKALTPEQKDKLDLSENDWCLFNDLCDDLNVDD